MTTSWLHPITGAAVATPVDIESGVPVKSAFRKAKNTSDCAVVAKSSIFNFIGSIGFLVGTCRVFRNERV
jgi:hypothetical protein